MNKTDTEHGVDIDLQTIAQRPPRLEYLNSMSSTEDRYDSNSETIERNECVSISQQSIKQPLSKLIWSDIFCARILVLFIVIFLCVLASLYCIGQPLKLYMHDYWCPDHTIEEVRRHNIELGLARGETGETCLVLCLYTV